MLADSGSAEKDPIRQPRGQGVQYVYEHLRDQIWRLELRPGSKLDEASVVRTLGVSRTPVREAIVRLASEQLVNLLPNRGAQVAPLDLLDLAQYFEALELSHRAIQHWAALRRTRQEVEEMGAARDAYREAAQSRDPVAMSETNRDFHLVIAAAGRNRYLQSVAYQLSIQGMRLSWIWYDNFATGDPNQDIERTIVEHDLIVDAIEARDAEQAERLAYQHVVAFRQRLIEQLGATLGGAVKIAPGEVMVPQDAR